MKGKIKKGLLFFLLLILSLPMLQSGLQIVDSGSLWGFTPSADVPFSIEGWWNNTYQHSKEIYANEQVGFHADFVRLNNQISYSFFDKPNFWKSKKGKENCMWGADYIEAYYGSDFIGQETMTLKMWKLRKLQDTLAALGKTLVMVYAPSKACYYPEYFPDEYTDMPRITSNLDCSVRLADSLSINHIDMNAWFLSMKHTTKAPLFLKSSIHWTVYGAELAADTLIKYLEQQRHINMPHIIFKEMPYSIKPMYSEYDLVQPMNLIQPPVLDTMCHPLMSYTTPKQLEKPKAIYIGDSFTWIWFETDIWNNVHKEWIFWNYFKKANKCGKMYDLPSMPVVTDTDWINDLLHTDCVVLVYTTINLKELGNGFIEKAYDHFYPQQ